VPGSARVDGRVIDHRRAIPTPLRSARDNVDTNAIPEPIGWEDSLTGLEGPDFWQRVLVAEVARASRYKRALTVVIAEVDGLTSMSGTWGSDVGRHAVREAAQCLRRASRSSDYCTRIGTARFGVVLTETDEIAAINYVERVREAGPRTMPRAGESLRFNFGWASPKQGESADALVRRAEKRLQAESLA
jgi:diguanylate cyclase (GGDEF)-like protein